MSDIQPNARLAQLDKNGTGMVVVPRSVFSGGNILLLIFLCFHGVKPLMPIILIPSSFGAQENIGWCLSISFPLLLTQYYFHSIESNLSCILNHMIFHAPVMTS